MVCIVRSCDQHRIEHAFASTFSTVFGRVVRNLLAYLEQAFRVEVAAMAAQPHTLRGFRLRGSGVRTFCSCLNSGAKCMRTNCVAKLCLSGRGNARYFNNFTARKATHSIVGISVSSKERVNSLRQQRNSSTYKYVLHCAPCEQKTISQFFLKIRTWHWLSRALLAARVLRATFAPEPEVGLPVRILLLRVRNIGEGVWAGRPGAMGFFDKKASTLRFFFLARAASRLCCTRRNCSGVIFAPGRCGVLVATFGWSAILPQRF